MTPRATIAAALVVAVAVSVAAPVTAGPARGFVRFVVRMLGARQAIDRGRAIHARWRTRLPAESTWQSVEAHGSSTAPRPAPPGPRAEAPAQTPPRTPGLRPRGPLR